MVKSNAKFLVLGAANNSLRGGVQKSTLHKQAGRLLCSKRKRTVAI